MYIGRNNKQNDYIISKLSKDEDYWFHTRLCAGSHVLLKVRETEPNEETLFECCKLAREYSSAKEPSKVGVIYTKRKYIKKPPASPLGYVIYKNENAKFKAIIESIKESHAKGQPVLVGTVSIEKSEKLSRALGREGIKHEVLNAKFHEKEAEIIA